MARLKENPRVTDGMARKWARKVVDLVKRAGDHKGSIYRALEKVKDNAELVTSPWPSESIPLGTDDALDPGVLVELEVTIPRRSERIEEPTVAGGWFEHPTEDEPGGRVTVNLIFPRDPSKRKGTGHLEILHRRVREVLKHEFEHAFQHKRGMEKDADPSFYEVEPDLKPKSKRDTMRYYLDRGEIEAYVAGLYLSAKKARKPLREVFEIVLGKIAESRNLAEKEIALIRKAWMDEAKKRYPRAVINPKGKRAVAPAQGRARSVELWGEGPFIRFGKWPKDEHSAIHYAYGDTRFTHEPGVSVYPAVWDKQNRKWGIDCRHQRAECWQNTVSNYSMFSQGLSEAFLVSGRIVGHGTDDEPLLRGLKVIKKLRSGDVHDPDSDYQLPSRNPSGRIVPKFQDGDLVSFIELGVERELWVATGKEEDFGRRGGVRHLVIKGCGGYRSWVKSDSLTLRKAFKEDSKRGRVPAWKYVAEELFKCTEKGMSLPGNPSRATSSSAALISTCQELWEHYCKRPGKKRLKAVLAHLEAMKESKSIKVKSERRRCLRSARAEARVLGMET